MEVLDFETWEEMNAWEEELERRISTQVGELPEDVARSVLASEHAGEWAIAARVLLQYAFVKGITVDSDLVKPALAFWGRQFFKTLSSLLFAGRWLTSSQIEEVFDFRISPAPILLDDSPYEPAAA